MICKNCGESMCGDGYKQVFHCPNIEVEYIEPDANPIYCIEEENMNLLNCIKMNQESARRNGNKVSASIHTVIIGECERLGKNLSDEEVVKVLQKMLKSSKEALSFSNPVTKEQVEFEIKVIESYLPQQLTEDEIKQHIDKLADSGYTEIKDIMAFFKNHFAGCYDSKMVVMLSKNVK